MTKTEADQVVVAVRRMMKVWVDQVVVVRVGRMMKVWVDQVVVVRVGRMMKVWVDQVVVELGRWAVWWVESIHSLSAPMLASRGRADCQRPRPFTGCARVRFQPPRHGCIRGGLSDTGGLACFAFACWRFL